MRKFVTALVAAIALAVVPVWRRAPRATGSGATVDELVSRLRADGLQGRDLADEAIRAVAQAVRYHSAWHLWETPERALKNGRGWAHQYNTALLLLLRDLGFEVRLVHAARVRGFGHPWFMSGHTWVKVRIGGHWLDACASSRANRAGRTNFVTLTRELPMYRRTRWGVALALVPFVIATVWRAWLDGDDVPGWLFEERQ